jgi:glycosyltransferase involved in cell wall biosynthesis
MENPLVSVVMPAYNAGKFIESAIKSILFQSYGNIELIIIDDGSTDNTLEIIKSFNDSRIILIKNNNNIGQPLSRNKAIGSAKGKYIANADADDINMSNRVEKQVKILEENPLVDVLGSGMYIVDTFDNILGKFNGRGGYTQHEELIDTIYKESPFPHPSIMGKREWFLKYPYRQRYYRAQDRELFLRTYQWSNFARIAECLFAWRVSDVVNLKKMLRNNLFEFQMLRHHWKDYSLPIWVVPNFLARLVLKFGYFTLANVCNRSFLWGRMEKLDPQEINKLQEWIKFCQNS